MWGRGMRSMLFVCVYENKMWQQPVTLIYRSLADIHGGLLLLPNCSPTAKPSAFTVHLADEMLLSAMHLPGWCPCCHVCRTCGYCYCPCAIM
jgi:hypothetical protein